MDVLLVWICRCSFFVRSFLVWISRLTVGFLPLPLTLQHRCVCVCVCVCVLQSLLSSLLIPSYSSILSLLFPVRPFQRFVVHSCHSLQHANNKVVGNTSVGSFLSPFISTYIRTFWRHHFSNFYTTVLKPQHIAASSGLLTENCRRWVISVDFVLLPRTSEWGEWPSFRMYALKLVSFPDRILVPNESGQLSIPILFKSVRTLV